MFSRKNDIKTVSELPIFGSISEPLTNGNHTEHEDAGENNATDLFKEHLATKPKSPADTGIKASEQLIKSHATFHKVSKYLQNLLQFPMRVKVAKIVLHLRTEQNLDHQDLILVMAKIELIVLVMMQVCRMTSEQLFRVTQPYTRFC